MDGAKLGDFASAATDAALSADKATSAHVLATACGPRPGEDRKGDGRWDQGGLQRWSRKGCSRHQGGDRPTACGELGTAVHAGAAALSARQCRRFERESKP
eukprot:scaffold549_cov385-Prasinococcus_capsulatus_cf.AAC.39